MIASCEELAIGASGFPLASSWRSFASLPLALMNGCMLRVNGAVHCCPFVFLKGSALLQLYHIAGSSKEAFAVSDVYVYDEASGQWQATTPLPRPLVVPSCTVLNCQGLVCGGLTIGFVLYVHFSKQREFFTEASVEAVLFVRRTRMDCQLLFAYLSRISRDSNVQRCAQSSLFHEFLTPQDAPTFSEGIYAKTHYRTTAPTETSPR